RGPMMGTSPSRFQSWLIAGLAAGLLSQAALAAPLPFSNGFEPPGSFTGWTTTRTNGSNVLVQSTIQAWGATQSLQFTYAGNTANAQAAAIVDFDTATNDVFVRFWLYLPTGTSAAMATNPGSSMRIVKLGDQATGVAGNGGNAKVNLLVTEASGSLYL